MIEFDFDRSSMDEMEKVHVPNSGTQEVVSKTGEIIMVKLFQNFLLVFPRS